MPDPSELDPEYTDDLEPLPEESLGARSSLPEGEDSAAGGLIGDLSQDKKALPNIRSETRKKARELESMDLEEDDEDTRAALEHARAARTRGSDAAEEPEPQPQDLEGRPTEAARPGPNAAPTDFEPLAWESSSTRRDAGFLVDEEGQPLPKARLSECVGTCMGFFKGVLGRLNILEKASVSVVLVGVLIGLVFFRSLVHSVPEPAEESLRQPLAALRLPAEANGVRVEAIKAEWRKPQPGEIVRPEVLMAPELTLRAGGSGFLRVLFRDEKGRIKGDPFASELSGSAQEFTVLCSQGYESAMDLMECQAGRQDPWTISIYQSSVYDVSIDEWAAIAEFDMPSSPTSKGY